MTLPDAAVWIAHLRRPDPQLVELLTGEQVISHSFVTGEVMLGSIASRQLVRDKLAATPDQVSTLIEQRRLSGQGIGYVDAHLLASTLLQPGTLLWTRDKRLHAQASLLKIAAAYG